MDANNNSKVQLINQNGVAGHEGVVVKPLNGYANGSKCSCQMNGKEGNHRR